MIKLIVTGDKVFELVEKWRGYHKKLFTIASNENDFINYSRVPWNCDKKLNSVLQRRDCCNQRNNILLRGYTMKLLIDVPGVTEKIILVHLLLTRSIGNKMKYYMKYLFFFFKHTLYK